MTLMSHFKKIIYLILAVGISNAATAGSYEDFFIAIRNDNTSALTALLQRGFDPNTVSEKGQPGLTMALQERSLKAAKLLLEQPTVKVDALNQAGESALMMAALKGDIASAKMLLERGAKVNQSGWSPLHYAATGPQPELVRLLLERGAEIDAASPNGTTPLMMAAQYGSEDSVTLLLDRGADPSRRNQRDLRAADFAKLAGREALAAKLQKLQR
jgi:ankyrin repeat protein